MLIAALALLTLAAALIVGASTLARASSRSARVYLAAFTAETEARHALASFLASWPAAAEMLPVGRTLLVEGSVSDPGEVVTRSTLRLLRLSPSTYSLSVDCRVGVWASPMARRRLRILLRRAVQVDTLQAKATPRPVARWPFEELY